MALTLLESAKYAKDSMTKAITELIAERSPILTYLPFETVDSGTFTFTREVALPGFAFRGVNETYPRSTGVIQDVSEAVKIMGGEVFIDRFQLKMHSNKRDLKARQWAMKTKAIKMGFSEYFFEGDSAANPRVFDGMRNRLTGTQVQETATNGAALDLDMLDELIDSVIGEGDGAHLFLNKTLRRKITNLGRNVSGSFPLIDVGDDDFGHQVTRYNGVPFHIIEREDNEATFLDFDETQGSSNVTASIYLIRFGDNYVHGIQGGGSGPEVYSVTNEAEAEIGSIGRIEWYVSFVIRHPRSAARLKGITNA